MKPHSNTGVEKRFIWSIILTSVIFLAEVVGGVWTGSLALLSDSAHVFLDLFALGLSYLALRLSALPADDRHSYGYHRLEVFAALINGVTLLVISLGIFYEAWQRWKTPLPIKSFEMLVIATVGLVVNVAVAIILRREDPDHQHNGRKVEDLNIKSALLHVMGDAISSVGVIIAAIIIWRMGWHWVDPLVSALIGIVILIGSGRVIKSSVHILIEGVPEGLSIKQIGNAIAAITGIHEVHDLHVWSLCSGHISLSAHIVVTNQGLQDSQAIMDELKRCLWEEFGIEHTTIQFECLPCGQGQSIINRLPAL